MTSKRVAVASLAAVLVLASGAAPDDDRRYGATIEALDRAIDAAAWTTVASLFSTDAVARVVQANAPVHEMPMEQLIAQERAMRASVKGYRAERGPFRIQQSSEGPLLRRKVTETIDASDGRTMTAVSDESYVFAETPAGARIVKLVVRIEQIDVRPQVPADIR
jgi:hypothetical protein